MNIITIILLILALSVAQAKKTDSIDFQSLIDNETQSQISSFIDFKASLTESSSSENIVQEMAREDRIVIKSGEAHFLELADKMTTRTKFFKKPKPLANTEKLQEYNFTRLDKELELLK
jgi:hypothetical protein